MAFSLKEVLNMYPFTLAKVVAGHDGMEVRVNSVNIVEVPEVVRWMRGGELLFTSGFAFSGDAKRGCAMLAELSSNGVAALAIKPGQHLKAIPSEMIDYANALGFPLLEIPENKPYMAFMEPILEKLINEQFHSLKRMRAVHDTLLQSMLCGNSIDELMHVLNGLIKCPAFITDIEGNISSSPIMDMGQQGEMEEALRELIAGLSTKQSEGLRTKRWSRLSGGGYEFVLVPLSDNGKRMAYVAACILKGNLMDIDIIAIENAGALASLMLLQEQALQEKEWQIAGDFLDDLLSHNYSDDAVIIRRAGFLRFDLSKPFIVYVTAFSLAHNSGDESMAAKEQSLKAEIQDFVRQQFTSQNDPVMLLSKSDHIVALHTVERRQDEQAITRTINKLSSAIEARFHGLDFQIGVGRQYARPHDAATSYNEALLAIKCLGSMRERSRVVTFLELGVFRFLCELQNSESMRSYLKEHMQPLIDYDREKKGDLVNTLRTYFKCGMNVRKTADALFMHKNSVVYRLKRIEEITDHALSSSEDVFQLQLCVKLMEII